MSEHEKPIEKQQQWSCEQGEGRRVLVTGATGFTATHLIDLLLRNGWKVRATVRDVNNEAKVGPVRRLGAEEGEEPKSELELVAADLLKDEDWSEAAKECDYIVHLAAIDPKSCKKDQSDMTWKTLKGLHNVLNSAFMSGSVKRFILAGSLAAVQGGLCGEDGRTYSEEDWTDPEKKDLHAWAEFKTKAELEAMKFVQALPADEKFQLVVLHPGLVVGPLLTPTAGASLEVIQNMLSGKMPMVPRMCTAITDVRDFASACVAAMTSSKVGQRYVVCSDTKWFGDLAKILHEEFGPMDYKIAQRRAPYFLMWIFGLFDPMANAMKGAIGNHFSFDNSKLKTELHVTPRDASESVVTTGHSLIQNGLVKKTAKYHDQASA